MNELAYQAMIYIKTEPGEHVADASARLERIFQCEGIKLVPLNVVLRDENGKILETSY